MFAVADVILTDYRLVVFSGDAGNTPFFLTLPPIFPALQRTLRTSCTHPRCLTADTAALTNEGESLRMATNDSLSTYVQLSLSLSLSRSLSLSLALSLSLSLSAPHLSIL